MPWQPALGTQPLAPFDHQVAGQSSMLRYDKTTVCKPLIARENFLYKTLPQELIEFTPEYRGEIEVQLTEEDGYIQLYGLCVGDDDDDDDASDLCASIPGNHSHEPLDVRPKVISKEGSLKNRSTIRVLRSGSYEVSPSTGEVFYAVDSNPDHPHSHSLNPWSLKNHKRLLDKMRKSEHSHNKIRFILLKNVVADFRHPCILDLKIGSRLHGDEASSVKVASQSEKCRRTTSSTLGVRLCGMQVYQVETSAYHSIDKYHGRTLNNESFREMLYNFLHNGTMFRSELIQPIVSRLSQLIDCLEKLNSFRFYASSLLIIYDGDVSLIPASQETKVKGSESDITVDMTPVESSIEHPISPKERCHPVDKRHDEYSHSSKESCHPHSSKESCHPHSSKEMCHSVEEHSCEYLNFCKEMCQCMKKQPNDVYCDFCSIPPSLQSFNISPDQHPQLRSNILELSYGDILEDVQITSFVHADATGENLSTLSTIPYHVTTLNLPITESLQQYPVENSMLEKEKHFYSSSQSIDVEETAYNHSVEQGPAHTSLSTLDVDKICVSIKNVSVHGSHHSESQTVQKLAVETDILSLTQPSSIYSIDSRQTQLPIDDLLHSVVLTRIQERLSDTVHVSKYDDTSCDIQHNHDISLLDSGCHGKSKKTQDKHSVYNHNETVSQAGSAESLEGKIFTKTDSMTSLLRQSSNSSTNSVKVDVKMIDFAHTTHKGFTADKIKHAGPDTDYIFGLRNLMKLFQELQGRE